MPRLDTVSHAVACPHGTNRNGPRAVVAFHGQVLPSRPGAHRVGHAAALIGWAPPAHGNPSTVATSRVSTMVARPCSGTGQMQQLHATVDGGAAGVGGGPGRRWGQFGDTWPGGADPRAGFPSVSGPRRWPGP